MTNNNNKNTINTTITSVSAKKDHFKNKLITDFKNHPSYILFISSLKSDYTKIKYN
jgi:hypothetical protein